MEVFTVEYLLPDGSVTKKPAVGKDAREIARTARAVGQARGWVPLYDSIEILGKPLTQSRNAGYYPTKKRLREFACAFKNDKGESVQRLFKAFDKSDAKTIARSIGREENLSPALATITPAGERVSENGGGPTPK